MGGELGRTKDDRSVGSDGEMQRAADSTLEAMFDVWRRWKGIKGDGV
jgi:hypothetical protein